MKWLMNETSEPQSGRLLPVLTLHNVPIESVLLHNGGPFLVQAKSGIYLLFSQKAIKLKLSLLPQSSKEHRGKHNRQLAEKHESQHFLNRGAIHDINKTGSSRQC